MEIRNDCIESPFFSFCIPQYNRTSFLLEALKALSKQTFKSFEICVSDDQSTDGREQELVKFLQESKLSFIYKKQEKNWRYDGNLRGSISLARGKYCFLHANDDCLASSSTLENIYHEIQKYESVGAIITNFEDWETGKMLPRVKRTQLVGSGPEIAATHYRNVTFVTGVLLDREQSQSLHTDKWDGSEMYQMYLFSRIVSSGKPLLELNLSAVKQSIQVPGELVDHISRWTKEDPCPIIERRRPMLQFGRVVADGIAPYLDTTNKHRLNEVVFLQLYAFTYTFWLVEYRRLQSWNYAIGLWLGMHPRNTFHGVEIGWLRVLRLYCLYYIIGLFGLTIPTNLFNSLFPILHSIAKSFFGRTGKPSSSTALLH